MVGNIPQRGNAGSAGGGSTGGSGLAPNIASMLCYLCAPITSIIFLLIEKENQDVRFHAWQGTALGVGYFVAVITLELVAAVFGMIATFLGTLIGLLIPLLGLASFVLWVICLIKSYQGERWRIPVLGDFAAQKAGIV